MCQVEGGWWDAMQFTGQNTFVSIPARVRAVYAPLEKPKIHILSPY